MIIKCAVYVRKSTEHGLEQAFNSLANQEQSCKAYISSQAFNNWEYTKTYSDGGISGGTMERPGLQEMLSDIAKGLINTIVVYKVDRLSRSILDFHNMMKYFDKYNCNFVSITQAFDTSTSMGKLTLNMLLSFAQFEREVASERVRDKIRASKAKGLWMGGIPPLGYDIKDKKLVINEAEVQQVKTLFEQYLEFQSVSALTEFAELNGIWAKKWRTRGGDWRGGKPITQMSMHRILRDKTYIGFISHKANGTCALPAPKFPAKITGNFSEHIRELSANNREFDKLTAKPIFILFFKVYVIFFEKRSPNMPQQTKSSDYLNKIVSVVMDRPLGTKHPKHGFVYEVNYGYIPNTVSGDGEELDAYVLGIDKPLKEFTGRCVAIIHRTNDNDDKLVVVPDGLQITNQFIEQKTKFQEQWFKHEIIR